MAKPKTHRFETLQVHAGQHPDPFTGARAVPIYQTAAYAFESADQATSIFNIERTGHIDSRISNPTTAVLEERVAALEDGIGAIATASGQAATHLAIATLMGAGSHIVASRCVHGGTYKLLAYTLPRFGIDTTFVSFRDMDAIRHALQPNTRLLFGQTLGDPGLDVLDIQSAADVAHQAGIPLLVDSTFTTPYLCKPLESGADLIVHSAAEFLSGHGVVMGGLLVDGGSFDWESSGKFPTLTERCEGLHDVDFVEEFGPAAFITRARWEGSYNFGACMSAHTAFLILQGIETLSLRMHRHIANTRAIMAFLNDHEAVEWVTYPELPAHPDYELTLRALPRGCGAVLSLGIRGGRTASHKLIDRLEVISQASTVGDAKSLVIHPASTTHQHMDADALQAAGISEGLIRMSVGLENPDDLIADLKRALRASQK